MNTVIGYPKDAIPCPFCASDKLIMAHMMFVDVPTDWPYRVGCGGCYTIGPRAASPPEAVRLWNERKVTTT